MFVWGEFLSVVEEIAFLESKQQPRKKLIYETEKKAFFWWMRGCKSAIGPHTNLQHLDLSLHDSILCVVVVGNICQHLFYRKSYRKNKLLLTS